VLQNRFKFPLVVLIALLQCLAPLIHAHVLGHDDAAAYDAPGRFHAHIHADEFAPALLSAPAAPAFTSQGDESPAIGVSQEFKQDHFLLPILGLMVAVFLLAAACPQALVFPRIVRSAARAASYRRPPATAPPARAA
jgi:hypothetical protein